MLSNDILRSVRYILKANNNDLVRILALGNVEATAEQIAVWLRKEDEEGFQRCPDIVLSSFLNGLIYEKRGKDESAPALEPERRINNNIVLKKLRIAFCQTPPDGYECRVTATNRPPSPQSGSPNRPSIRFDQPVRPVAIVRFGV